MELPIAFQEEMKRLLQESYEAYIESYEKPRYAGLRVNTTKISPEEFEKKAPFTLKKVPWTPNGYYYDEETDKPSRHPYYGAGLYYIQEPSAMTPAAVLPVEEGDRVLDLCAAPGGKATELAAKLNHTGVLVANDISNSRAKGLLKNLELFGMPNILVTSETPERLCRYFGAPAFFHKILIDAPCSGEGMFRKDNAMIKSWQEHGPEYYAAIQKEIIEQAASMLQDGGQMLYSTCTFSPLENEAVIQHLLDSHPEFHVVPIPMAEGFAKGMPEAVNGSGELSNCVRLFPHRIEGEGHFLALLQKGEKKQKATEEAPEKSRKRVKELPKELEEFLQLVAFPVDAERLEIRDGHVYLLPEGLPSIKGLRFLRTGLFLGELLKNRFEPSQALAMALKPEQFASCIHLESEDPRVLRYLKGETLDTEDLQPANKKGWQLVCVDGYPLGFGKLQNGTLKNKYYPGWRWQL